MTGDLTVKEIDVLKACYENEYHTGDELPQVWAFTVTDNSNLPASSVPGVVSSLQKKGLVVCQDNGDDDNIICVTEAGDDVYQNLSSTTKD